MFWKVLDTLARRGGSGSPCAEQGLPNEASESWSHTSYNHQGWLALWLWLPTAGESWCYPPPWEPGRHPHTHPQIGG